MIKLSCPRCNRDMALTDEHRGQYAFCKHCDGRVWVPTDTPPKLEQPQIETSPKQTKAEQSPLNEPQKTHPNKISGPPTNQPHRPAPGPPPIPTQGIPSNPTKLKETTSKKQKITNPSPTDPPPPTDNAPERSSRHHATLITAEPAKSVLAVTSDGQLPALALQTNDPDEASAKPPVESNRWMTLGIICVSLLFTSILLLYESSPPVESISETKRQIRLRIQEKYFGPASGPWSKYQRYLREAALARSQGNYQAEERYYRKVLHLLNGQHLDKTDQGVTGLRNETSDRSLKSDQELESLLTDLLINNKN